jgi:dihydroneopterin aldolase
MDKIFIKKLQVYGYLGIHLQEQQIPQLIQISLSATSDIRNAAINDDIRQTINYSTLAKKIKKFISVSHYRTIEGLIEALSVEILKDRRIISLWVRIEKPNAVPNSESVGVEIFRNNEQN